MKKVIENILSSKGFTLITASSLLLILLIIVAYMEGCAVTAEDDLILNQENYFEKKRFII